eukprot:755674_1
MHCASITVSSRIMVMSCCWPFNTDSTTFAHVRCHAHCFLSTYANTRVKQNVAIRIYFPSSEAPSIQWSRSLLYSLLGIMRAVESHQESTRSKSRSRSRSRDRTSKHDVNKGLDENEDEDQTKNEADLSVFRHEILAEREMIPSNHYTMDMIPPTAVASCFSASTTVFYGRALNNLIKTNGGYYEDLPIITVHDVDIQFRWFPHGRGVSSTDQEAKSDESKTCIGVMIVNKHQLLSRIQSDCCSGTRDMDIHVFCGGQRDSSTINLDEFRTESIVYRTFSFGCDLIRRAKSKNIEIKCVIKLNHHTTLYTNSKDNMRLFELTQKFGNISVFSCSDKEYKIGDDIYIQGIGKENIDKENIQGIDEENIIKMDKSLLASMGHMFEAMFSGTYSTCSAVSINCPTKQIENLCWYACTQELHPSCDPVYFAALAHFLDNSTMRKKALNRCYVQLSFDTVKKHCALYTFIKVGFGEGLHLLSNYIKRNMTELQRHGLFKELEKYPYVMSHAKH